MNAERPDLPQRNLPPPSEGKPPWYQKYHGGAHYDDSANAMKIFLIQFINTSTIDEKIIQCLKY